MKNEKEILLEMMDKIDTILSENGIWYCLACGSVLGAVRHNGFIPWDTDVDIFIKIEDREKLRDILYKTLKDSDYRLYRGCIDVVSTHDVLVKREDKIMRSHIDIYPLIGAPNTKIKQAIFAKSCSIFNRIINAKYSSYKRIKKKWKIPIFFIFKGLLHLIPDKLIYKIILGIEKHYNNEVRFCTYIANDGKASECIDKEVFLETKRCKFEHLSLPIPSKYKCYLISTYGEDYMIPRMY